MAIDHKVWAEKYRPTTLDEVILPKRIKDVLEGMLEKKQLPNLLLSGEQPGIGKTTTALILANQLNYDYLMINASKDGNIDTLRTKIQNFASTMSISGKQKMVILDEADGLSHATMPALRNFMENYSKNCVFILTCNNEYNIIEPLRSRCSTIHFDVREDEKKKLMGQLLKRVEYILKQEGVEYDKRVCGTLILRFFPDNRRILNELQSYANCGCIDSGLLASIDLSVYNDLFEYMKKKDWENVKNWVFEHSQIPFHVFVKDFYGISYKYCQESAIPGIVILLNDYSYKNNFVVNKDINTLACLTEIMMNCEGSWK